MMAGPPHLVPPAAAASVPSATAQGGRFNGRGLLSLPLESGDVLVFRQYESSSLGLPFNCVWHRDPAGSWAAHLNVTPSRSSLPFLAPGLSDVTVGEIQVKWRNSLELSVSMPAIRLSFAVRIAAGPATRMAGAFAALLPAAAWRQTPTLRAAGRAASLLLRTSPLCLYGRAPGGHALRVRPSHFWQVEAAAAVLAGHDLGSLGTAAEPPLLAGLPLPRRALFASLTEEFLPPPSLLPL
jgi:hypothetical protein